MSEPMSSSSSIYPSVASSAVQGVSGLVRLPGGRRLDVGALRGLPSGERERVEGQLVQWLGAVRRNPLLAFEPFAKQAEFLGVARSGEIDVKLAHAGNQAGKTEVGVADDVIQCVDRSCLPEHLQRFKFWEPPFLCRVVTMDLGASLYDVVLPKFRKLVPVDQLATPGGASTDSFDAAFDKTLRVLHFRNGSRVQFMSAEQDRSKHQGATLDRVHFDEEPPPPNGFAIYEESRMRVAARAGQLMFTMTPLVGAGMTWTYDEIFQRRGDPDVSTVNWGMRDNPYLPRGIIVQQELRIPSEKMRRARIDGDFVAFRGRVFEEFDEARHVVPPVKPGDLRGMDVIVGYDPGIRRAGVVWCAFDRDNSMLVFDELYPENESVESIFERVTARNRFWGVTPDFYVIDPAMRIRDMSTAQESVQSTLIRLGFPVIPGQNDRDAGINQIKRRLESDALRVSSSCVSWLRECDRYLVAADEETAEGKPKTGKGHSFATLGPDHLMDPTRYVAMSRVWGPPPEDVRAERRLAYRHGVEDAWVPVQGSGVSGPMGPLS